MDPDHDDAVDLALRHRLTVITGGPGTGKNHGGRPDSCFPSRG